MGTPEILPIPPERLLETERSGVLKEITDTQDFRISLIHDPDPGFLQTYEAMAKEIQESYGRLVSGTLRLPPHYPEGFSCMAKDPVSEEWRRGRILGDPTHEGLVPVFFLDYGNKENIEEESIKQIKDRFKELPAGAIRCSLEGLEDKGEAGMSKKDGTRYLARYLEQRLTCQIHSQDPLSQKYSVDLLSVPDGGEESHSLAVGIRNIIRGSTTVQAQPTGLTAARDIGRIVEGLPSPQLMSDVIRTMEVIPSFVDKDCQKIYVQKKDWSHHVARLALDMNEYYSKNHAATSNGSLGAVQWDEDKHWYRALVTQTRRPHDTTNIEIQFIDYGNTEVVEKRDLLVLKDEYRKDPALAFPIGMRGPHPSPPPGFFKNLQRVLFKDASLVCTLHIGTVYGPHGSSQMYEGILLLHHARFGLAGDYDAGASAFSGTLELKGPDGKSEDVVQLALDLFSPSPSVSSTPRASAIAGLTARSDGRREEDGDGLASASAASEEDQVRPPGNTLGHNGEKESLPPLSTLPSLIQISQLGQVQKVPGRYQTVSIPPGERLYPVRVTGVCDPGELWMTFEETNKDFLLISSVLEKRAQVVLHDPISCPVFVGRMCYAMDEKENDEWSRAEVRGIMAGGRELYIFFVDQGYGEIKMVENVYPLPERLKNIPRLAFRASLGGMVPLAGMANAFLELSTREKNGVPDSFWKLKAQILGVSGGDERGEKLEVELETEDGLSVGEMMVWKGVGRAEEEEGRLQRYPEMDLEVPQTDEGQLPTLLSVRVRHAANPQSFFVAPRYGFEERKAGIEKKLRNAWKHREGQGIPETEAEPGLPVMLMEGGENGKPARGEIRRVFNRGRGAVKAYVRFVDSGKRKEVFLEHLYSLPQDLIRIPKLVLECSLRGLVSTFPLKHFWPKGVGKVMKKFLRTDEDRPTFRCALYGKVKDGVGSAYAADIVGRIVYVGKEETVHEVSLKDFLIQRGLVRGPPGLSKAMESLESGDVEDVNLVTEEVDFSSSPDDEADVFSLTPGTEPFVFHLIPEKYMYNFEQIQGEITKALALGLEHVTSVFKGAIVMGRFPDGGYRRCRVISEDEEVPCTVLCMDYGNEAQLGMGDIFPIPESARILAALPDTSVKCQLDLILPTGEEEAAKNVKVWEEWKFRHSAWKRVSFLRKTEDESGYVVSVPGLLAHLLQREIAFLPN